MLSQQSLCSSIPFFLSLLFFFLCFSYSVSCLIHFALPSIHALSSFHTLTIVSHSLYVYTRLDIVETGVNILSDFKAEPPVIAYSPILLKNDLGLPPGVHVLPGYVIKLQRPVLWSVEPCVGGYASSLKRVARSVCYVTYQA